MKKWRGIIAFDVAMAIAAIALFGPAGLGLSPFSPNLFAAAFSVIAGAFMIYELVKVNGRALLTARAQRRVAALGPGVDEVTAEDARRTLGEYEKTSVVGTYARHAVDELDRVEAKRSALYDAIGQKFAEGSLTWHKFTEVVDSAAQAVVHNSALLARRIQDFDVEDYNRNARDTITGMFRRSTLPEGIRQEKRQLYEASLNDMRGIVSSNERLLLELDRFSLELGQLETSANAEANNRLLAEVNELVDETKYYR